MFRFSVKDDIAKGNGVSGDSANKWVKVAENFLVAHEGVSLDGRRCRSLDGRRCRSLDDGRRCRSLDGRRCRERNTLLEPRTGTSCTGTKIKFFYYVLNKTIKTFFKNSI
jgi:hypothetical protein